MPVNKPNLIVIGAMKSGTSSLHAWLGAHPDIFMCEPKEPCYFVERKDLNWPYVEQLGLWRGEEYYLELFAGAGGAHVVGESSTLYTKLPRIRGVPERIARFNPEARFIYLMRDPIERTISHYWHMVRHHGEHRSMECALRETSEYCDVSHYAMQLRPYFDVFGAERVLTLTLEELVVDTSAVLGRVFAWLGVDSTFVPAYPLARENATPAVVTQVRGRGLLDRFRRSPVWNAIGAHMPRVVRRLGRSLSERAVDRESHVPPRVLDWLRPIQQEQTESLKRLLGRDFPQWTTLYGSAAAATPGVVRPTAITSPVATSA